jgi:amino acid permease
MLTKYFVGGSIGTATFVSISSGLLKGGPGSLFLAYTIYTCMLGLVNNCQAEMSSYMPVTGGFIRMSGKWVDEALGFMIGWSESLSLTLRAMQSYINRLFHLRSHPRAI